MDIGLPKLSVSSEREEWTPLQRFSAAFHISVEVFHDGYPVMSWQKNSRGFDPACVLVGPYVDGDEPVCHVFSPDLLMAGYIELDEPGWHVVVGPACPTAPTREQVGRLLMQLGIDRSLLDGAMTYMGQMPHMSALDFTLMIDLLSSMVRSDRGRSVKMTYRAPNAVEVRRQLVMLEPSSPTMVGERRLGEMIRQGQADELVAYMENMPDREGIASSVSYAPDALRSIKNTAIAATPEVARYARKGGLDYGTSIELSDRYIALFERLEEYPRVTQAIVDMMADFARRVADVQLPSGVSAVVERACRDVQAHRNERLTASEIAGRLGVSVGYLQQCFKKETGMTLGRYVRERKMREARFLLESSELTLAQIARRLSYPSQQQFQTVFHQMVGVTPKHYRDAHRR